MSHIAVMGSGAWGTAIALSLAQRGGHRIALQAHSEASAAVLRERGENAVFLPGFPLPKEIRVTADAAEALEGAEIVVGVMPSQYVRHSFERFAPYLHEDQVLVSASKGIEDETGLRMTEVIASVLRARGLHLPVAALGGPSFAQEVAAGSPTAITVATPDMPLAVRLQREFSSGTLRLYTNEDVIGVELGGALKNVIAIAAGVVTGLELGHNSMAALITRGVAEITRLAVACGGRRETLAGLSGLGDLVLTCTGSLSRNRTVGIELGRGRRLPEILEGLHGKVAEGVRTTPAALGLARRHGVEMPIAEQMAAILHQGKSPVEAIRQLMQRPGRDE
ncbi:NAD(P)H-dependent glycerol-3-phosphate dehydrogenase [Paracidobacterium acidisoli]|uniref:Glycerol-3-phosphate dehydrogenase [NAD(P)+] n=1 Tax=Paracidobacterium acidisoli TaxID=2303751 RepID=A0A372ITE2_9BACT|nr:NAD(P)H-dependent glycerol-3-phosphate dehydrogenase [Paracidobacterium acidisoli]MBT9329633.1 NAD(P)-dependent glycerol-3-phosphate dehydrogenase [Paracidobacterium acidisoli]